MKKILLTGLLGAVSSLAAAESSFDYSYVDLSYTRVTIEEDSFDENLHRHDLFARGSGELSDQYLLRGLASMQGINQEVTLDGEDFEVQTTDLVVGLELARYFVLGSKADVSVGAGIGHIQSETTVTYGSDSLSTEYQATPLSLTLNSRIMLGGSGKLQLEPSYQVEFINDDSSSRLSASLQAELLSDVLFYVGYGVYPDDDAQEVTFGIRFN